MRRVLAAAALAVSFVSAPLAAQETAYDDTVAASDDEALLAFSDRMSDPEYQRETALMVSTVSEVLLDLPLAPILSPLVEAVDPDAEPIDPRTTLRSMAPDAGIVSEELEERLPQAMSGLAALSEGLAASLPAMRETLGRLSEALDRSRERLAE